MTTRKTNGLLKADPGRTGTHGTIYSVKRDPKLTRKDHIKDKNVHEFGFVNGSSYKGEWDGNKKHGFGIETSTDGTKYEGEWSQDKRHGRGTLWVKKNKIFVKVYAGGWSNNKMEGQGVYSYEDGTVYKGNFHQNKRSNFGRLEYPNGDVYSGDWVDDAKQGVGSLFLSNGNIYEGYWVDNNKEGPGKFFYAATNKVRIPSKVLQCSSRFVVSHVVSLLVCRYTKGSGWMILLSADNSETPILKSKSDSESR